MTNVIDENCEITKKFQDVFSVGVLIAMNIVDP